MHNIGKGENKKNLHIIKCAIVAQDQNFKRGQKHAHMPNEAS